MAATLYLSCDHGLKRVLVDVAGEDRERLDLEPLARFLRRQHPWPGHDRIELRVDYPRAIREALRPATLTRSAEQLEREAAIVWFPPMEWRDPVHLFDWLTTTREALTEELHELADQHPELPLGGEEGGH